MWWCVLQGLVAFAVGSAHIYWELTSNPYIIGAVSFGAAWLATWIVVFIIWLFSPNKTYPFNEWLFGPRPPPPFAPMNRGITLQEQPSYDGENRRIVAREAGKPPEEPGRLRIGQDTR